MGPMRAPACAGYVPTPIEFRTSPLRTAGCRHVLLVVRIRLRSTRGICARTLYRTTLFVVFVRCLFVTSWRLVAGF